MRSEEGLPCRSSPQKSVLVLWDFGSDMRVVMGMAGCINGSLRGWPVWAYQTRAVWSAEQVTMRLPSGQNSTLRIQWEWCMGTPLGSPVAASQSLIGGGEAHDLLSADLARTGSATSALPRASPPPPPRKPYDSRCNRVFGHYAVLH